MATLTAWEDYGGAVLGFRIVNYLGNNIILI